MNSMTEDFARRYAKVVEELIELKDDIDAIEEKLRSGHRLTEVNGCFFLTDPSGHTVATGPTLRQMAWLF